MPYQELEKMQRRGKFPKIIIYISNRGTEPFENYDGLNQYSRLKLYGYRVGRTGLDSSSRRAILDYVIKHKILSIFDICNHLQFQISLREGMNKDYSEAIYDWKTDIEYVIDKFTRQEYINDNYSKVEIQSVILYNKKNIGVISDDEFYTKYEQITKELGKIPSIKVLTPHGYQIIAHR